VICEVVHCFPQHEKWRLTLSYLVMSTMYCTFCWWVGYWIFIYSSSICSFKKEYAFEHFRVFFFFQVRLLVFVYRLRLMVGVSDFWRVLWSTLIEPFSGTECIFFRTLVELTKKWIGPSQCSCKNVSHVFKNNTTRIMRFNVVPTSVIVCHFSFVIKNLPCGGWD